MSIKPGIDNPYFHLALEEFLLKALPIQDEIYFFTYTNTNSLILGRNQNVYQEIRLDKVKEHRVQVCRRVSGGGTVYHDKGNLNICWIAPKKSNWVNSYSIFLNPLIELLGHLGVQAGLNQRNALVTGDFKVSGTAQFTSGERLLCRCTLLIDADLNILKELLAIQSIEAHSIASKSVSSKVINLKDLIPDINLEKMEYAIKEVYCENRFTPVEIPNWIELMPDSFIKKYSSFDWIFARSPKSILIAIARDYVIPAVANAGNVIGAREGEVFQVWLGG